MSKLLFGLVLYAFTLCSFAQSEYERPVFVLEEKPPCDTVMVSYIDRAGHAHGNKNQRLNENLSGLGLRCETLHRDSFPYESFYELGGMTNSNNGDTFVVSLGVKTEVLSFWRISGYVGGNLSLAYYEVPQRQAYRFLPLPGVLAGVGIQLFSRKEGSLSFGKEETRLLLGGVKIRRYWLKYTLAF